MLFGLFGRRRRLRVFDKEIADFVRATEAAYPAHGAQVGIDAARTAYDKMCAVFRAPRPEGVVVEDLAIDGPAGPLPLRIYRPEAASSHSVRLLYFHGGGFVVGGLESHDDVCAEIAAATGRELVAVDYRLAPEHPFPAAHDDAAAAARWYAAQGPYVAIGDSVGGTIAATLCSDAIGADWAPSAALLIYPGLGGEALGLASYSEHVDAPLLSLAELRACWKMRAGEGDVAALMRTNRRFAPLAEKDLSGLPQMAVFSAEIDPLRDDGPEWVDRLKASGVPARSVMGRKLPHGCLRARHRSAQAAKFFNDICREAGVLARVAESMTESSKSGTAPQHVRQTETAQMSIAETNPPSRSTYSTYDELPPLPVPEFDDTCRRYLESVEPLLSAEEFEKVASAMAAFAAPDGVGRKLHAALKDKAATADNWLSDWWDDIAYLGYPEPILINSNFGISVDARAEADDPATRAAEVAARTVDFVHQLWSETFPPETVGRNAAPIDMTLFRRIFGSVRVPGLVKDEIVVHPHEKARHIFVMRKGRCFAVEALGPDGRTATVEDLRAAFQRIIDATDASAPQEPVAVLTTERRPVWALERQRLLADPSNAETLEMIETAMFGLYFDEEPAPDHNAVARAAIMGRPGTHWMDKVYNYIVHGDGRVSQHGEHSPADGMQFVTAFDYGCDNAEWRVFRERPEEKARSGAPVDPKEYGFALSQESHAGIRAATAHFEAKTEDLDIEVLTFGEFGKSLIKTLGTGPDSFVQMAYQLAYWRNHGRTPKTYESGQTRAFRLGRTETIRSVSVASRDFTAAMDDPSASAESKVELLRAAFAAHGERGKLAAMGQGVDRHLLGMKLIAGVQGVSDGLELFDQEIWTRGWELSTAQLPMKGLLVNGFGPVCWQGYGIGYVIRDDSVTCHVSSWRSHPKTSSASFAASIAQAMRDMKALLQS